MNTYSKTYVSPFSVDKHIPGKCLNLLHCEITKILIKALFTGQLDSVNSVHLLSFVFRYICYFTYSNADRSLVVCRCSKFLLCFVWVCECVFVYEMCLCLRKNIIFSSLFLCMPEFYISTSWFVSPLSLIS